MQMSLLKIYHQIFFFFLGEKNNNNKKTTLGSYRSLLVIDSCAPTPIMKNSFTHPSLLLSAVLFLRSCEFSKRKLGSNSFVTRWRRLRFVFYNSIRAKHWIQSCLDSRKVATITRSHKVIVNCQNYSKLYLICATVFNLQLKIRSQLLSKMFVTRL